MILIIVIGIVFSLVFILNNEEKAVPQKKLLLNMLNYQMKQV
ncbi:hypothetical protein [Allocoprobacillus halotolerans]|nr:hypothetical protein [Allocoprobacillus halotolerans]